MSTQPNPKPVSQIDLELGPIAARTRRLQAIVVVIGAVLIMVFGVGTGYLLSKEDNLSNMNAHLVFVTACQLTYNQKYAQVQQIRSRLTDANNAATETLISSVFTIFPGESRSQSDTRIEAAYATYRNTEKAIEKSREEHPVPKTPNC